MVAACNTIPLTNGTEYRGSNPALADFQPRPVVPVAAAYEQTQNLQRLFSAEVDGIARGGVDWKFAAAMGGVLVGGFCVFLQRGRPEWAWEASGTDLRGPVAGDRVGILFCGFKLRCAVALARLVPQNR